MLDKYLDIYLQAFQKIRQHRESTAPHHTTPHRTAPHYTALHYTTLHYTALQQGTMQFGLLFRLYHLPYITFRQP